VGPPFNISPFWQSVGITSAFFFFFTGPYPFLNNTAFFPQVLPSPFRRLVLLTIPFCPHDLQISMPFKSLKFLLPHYYGFTVLSLFFCCVSPLPFPFFFLFVLFFFFFFSSFCCGVMFCLLRNFPRDNLMLGRFFQGFARLLSPSLPAVVFFLPPGVSAGSGQFLKKRCLPFSLGRSFCGVRLCLVCLMSLNSWYGLPFVITLTVTLFFRTFSYSNSKGSFPPHSMTTSSHVNTPRSGCCRFTDFRPVSCQILFPVVPWLTLEYLPFVSCWFPFVAFYEFFIPR